MKILVIDKCDNCFNCTKGWKFICELSKKELDRVDEIPKWCELKDSGYDDEYGY